MKIKKILLLAILTIFILSIFAFAKNDASSDVSKNQFKVKKIETDEYTALVQPRYTVVDDPSAHITYNFEGVAELSITKTDGYTYGCSGTLLLTGKHVLTAAHCVSDDKGNENLNSGTARFYKDGNIYSVNFDSVTVHPDWDGDILRGNDVAIIELDEEMSTEIERYDIDRTFDEVGNVYSKVGYGISGLGLLGVDRELYPFGYKRTGLNKYDSYADTLLSALRMKAGRDYVPNSVLMYDFDDGISAHDAFGFFFGINELGLGTNEVSSAPGDSGGPTIIDNTVVGITSYGISLNLRDGSTSDVTPGIDSSFGEFSGDTNVAKYASFIDSVTSGTTEPTPDPEPEPTNCPPGLAKKGLC